MNAKEYLGRIRKLDTDIERRLQQLSAMRDVVYKTTSSLTYAPGGDHDPKRKENLMSKIVDAEAEIDTMTDLLADMKGKAIELMYGCCTLDQCHVLEGRYIKLQTWEQVAVSVGKCLRAVYMINADGLRALDNFLKKENLQ